MKFITVIILLAVVFGSAAFAEVTKLDVKQRKIIETSAFRQLHSVKELPSELVALCADENNRLADPGQKWQVSDVIYDKNLPRKRLIWAATFKDYYVVHYEKGGYAHSFHVLLAKTEKTPKILWHGIGVKLSDFNEFKNALKENKLDDRREYIK